MDMVDVGSSVSDVGSSDSVSSVSEASSTPVVESQGGSDTPAYTPNWEFRVKDTVHQMPEWVRGSIKDKAAEEQARDVFSRAYGLDGLKSNYEKAREELGRYGEVQKKFDEQSAALKQLVALRDADFGQFLQAVGVTDDAIYAHYEALKRSKDDPTFAAQYNAGLEARRNSISAAQTQEQLRQQVAELEAYKHEVNRERHFTQMETVLKSPEVASFASSFDRLSGRDGAFQDEVRTLGDYLYRSEGRYYSPKEVVPKVLEKYRAFVNANQSQVQPDDGVAPARAARTIPNVGNGSGAAVTRKRFTSIDEIKKHYEKNFGE